MLNEFRTFDEGLEIGVLVVPPKEELDIGALREYCKKNNRKYDELTDKEIEQFIINAPQSKIS